MNRRTFSLRAMVGAALAPTVRSLPPPANPVPGMGAIGNSTSFSLTKLLVPKVIPEAYKALFRQRVASEEYFNHRNLWDQKVSIPADIEILKLPPMTKHRMAVERELRKKTYYDWTDYDTGPLERLFKSFGFFTQKEPISENERLAQAWEEDYRRMVRRKARREKGEFPIDD